jgi:DNA-binding HxlR family transcriptional regulator
LSLLSTPLNVYVLRALEEESRPLGDLRHAVGSPAQTTMRGHLRRLAEIGVVERRRQSDFPGSVDYELGGPGHELLAVAEVLQAWLADSPDGPAQLGSPAAKSAIKALVEGWSSAVVRALVAKPLSLTELSRLITGLSYPSLERRLGALRLAGQIERRTGNGRGTPYAVTDWLRRAMAPLAAAVRWERLHLADEAPPLGRIDVEAAFMLAIPLLELPVDLSGHCRLAVELSNGNGNGNGGPRLAGVQVGVQEGRVASCISRLEGDAEAWASGSPSAWLGALIEQDSAQLELGGDGNLALGLLDGLHSALFRAPQRV